MLYSWLDGSYRVFFWKNATEVRGHFYHIVSASLITVDVDLDHMAEILRAKFSVGRLVFFPLFLWEEVTKSSPHLRGKNTFCNKRAILSTITNGNVWEHVLRAYYMPMVKLNPS